VSLFSDTQKSSGAPVALSVSIKLSIQKRITCVLQSLGLFLNQETVEQESGGQQIAYRFIAKGCAIYFKGFL